MIFLNFRIWRETQRRYKDITTLFLVSTGKVWPPESLAFEFGAARSVQTMKCGALEILESRMFDRTQNFEVFQSAHRTLSEHFLVGSLRHCRIGKERLAPTGNFPDAW